jgi:hypothetical protein
VKNLRDQGIPGDDIAGALRHRLADLRSSDGIGTMGADARGIVDSMIASCLDGAE